VPATVLYIIDGDTFGVNVNLDKDVKIKVHVRIKNIDTPEIHGGCESEINLATKAKDRLASLIPVGSVVDLSEIKDDKYLGRIDAIVKAASGQEIGSVLINENMARKYSGGHRYSWCDNAPAKSSNNKSKTLKTESETTTVKMNDWTLF
jgi:endonuclease YncB( thermonuclease family)